jgi:hypothetical protein
LALSSSENLLALPVILGPQWQWWHEPIFLEVLRRFRDLVRENRVNGPYTLTLLENLSWEICTPWGYKQLAGACLSPGDFLIWKAKYYDECDKQAQRNRDTGVPLTEDQLQGVGPFANALQQMKGMPQYFDQVRLCAKNLGVASLTLAENQLKVSCN